MTTATRLSPSDLTALRKQIVSATAAFRAAYDAADTAMASGDARAPFLCQVAAAALRKRDRLLEQHPRGNEP